MERHQKGKKEREEKALVSIPAGDAADISQSHPSPKKKSLKMHQNNVTIARVKNKQACAACKYQRRKCPPDCILAPYFPHDRQRQFFNAHKLFGVSNITKIIRHLDQATKDEAMRTIIFQSDVRANDPVGGCYRIVHQLRRQIYYAEAELNIVLQQLASCKAEVQAARVQQQQIMQLAGDDATDSTANYDIFSLDTMGGSNEQNINIYHHIQPHQGQDVSLQEFSDSWGMQGSVSSLVPIEKLPSPPRECHDFSKTLDFSINHPHDINFDYETKIEQSGDANNLTENKAALEDESFQCAQDRDFKGC